MSDELRLPDELAACEARLAAQLLPASRLDRDALMYRAGWAACEAQRLGDKVPAAKIPSTRGRTTGWSLASAAIAASLAVVATLRFQDGLGPDRRPLATTAQTKTLERSADNRVANLPQERGGNAPAPASLAMLKLAPGVGISSAASLLNARDLAISQSSLEPQLFQVSLTSNHAVAAPNIAAKTARQLLNEYLPDDSDAKSESKPPRRLQWLWNLAAPGETI